MCNSSSDLDFLSLTEHIHLRSFVEMHSSIRSQVMPKTALEKFHRSNLWGCLWPLNNADDYRIAIETAGLEAHHHQFAAQVLLERRAAAV
jgi:hypothetical protein